MAGTLYLCATPIGNLDDITLRVLDTLKKVDIVAAEDTRHTMGLLNHFGIKASLTSYHEHNKYDKARVLADELLEGKDIALVTDAGTPGISDPGEELVRLCNEEGIHVTSLPGASAVITALSMSGLSSRRFVFEGFLEQDKKERRAALGRIADESRTIVIYEAPHRIVRTLSELYEVLGDRQIRICRELTKIHEEVMAFTVSEALEYFNKNEPRGEMVVIIEGISSDQAKAAASAQWEALTIAEHVEKYISEGMSEKDAMKKAAADRGISRRDIYKEIKT